ncbi:MAG: 4-hydroxy-3-methylbut-2-enyl diphosphate reductase [Candidatus Omnitrophica bacterium]|nr:4-hydroxy-3-methylbut-2-enyl diphosphate reductase [Candidatus Omnitrophota bacterium]
MGMQINLAKSAGFCFGVKRAIDLALKTAGKGGRVYMLGDIVHNEDVISKIQKAGIKKIKALSAGRDKILILRAHGTCIQTLRRARHLGYTVVDATCPMVKEIHRIAKEMEKEGRRVIIIGDKKHDEVHGISGQLKKSAVVIDSIGSFPLNRMKKIKKAAVVVQSTQDTEKVLEIVAALKRLIPELRFYNTVCRPTRIKQEEIRRMPLENDLMIIIGSKTSANTKRLYEISRSLNKRSYRVQSKKDITPDWFRGVKTVGVTAGASTPDSTIQEIVRCLRNKAGRP